MPKRTSIYKGEVVDLGIEEVVLPNQQHMQLEVIRHPGGAAVVAVDDSSRICLLHQYRHAGGGWIWELPAGKIDLPEVPENTAKRELQEEAGIIAEHWQSLGSFLSTPGFCDERIHLYLARGLTLTDTDRHPHEVIEVHWLDYATTLEHIECGKIIDGKTMLGLLLARPYLA